MMMETLGSGIDRPSSPGGRPARSPQPRARSQTGPPRAPTQVGPEAAPGRLREELAGVQEPVALAGQAPLVVAAGVGEDQRAPRPGALDPPPRRDDLGHLPVVAPPRPVGVGGDTPAPGRSLALGCEPAA